MYHTAFKYKQKSVFRSERRPDPQAGSTGGNILLNHGQVRRNDAETNIWIPFAEIYCNRKSTGSAFITRQQWVKFFPFFQFENSHLIQIYNFFVSVQFGEWLLNIVKRHGKHYVHCNPVISDSDGSVAA